MNTSQTRFLIVGMILALAVLLTGFTMATGNELAPIINANNANLELVQAFAETQDIALYTADAELDIAGFTEAIVGQDAIENYLKRVYHGYGTILGVSLEAQNMIALSDNLVYFAYTYHGTAFHGDLVPLETMLDSELIAVPMVSIFEIENGLIVREFVFEGQLPKIVDMNEEWLR